MHAAVAACILFIDSVTPMREVIYHIAKGK